MNLFALAGLSVALSCAALFAVVFFFARNRVHRLQALFSLVCALWGLGAFLAGTAATEASAIVGWKVAHVGGLLVGPVFYHFVVVLSGRVCRPILVASYAQALLFIVAMLAAPTLLFSTRFTFDMYYLRATGLYPFAWVAYAALVLLSYQRLVSFRQQARGRARTQASYVTFGSLFGFVGATSTFLPAFGVDAIYPAGNIGITVYCAIVSYAILRHRLMDLRVALGKGLVYLLTAALLAAALDLTHGFVESIAGIGDASRLLLALVGALVALMLLNPGRRGAQWLVERILGRKAKKSYETARHLCHRLAAAIDLQSVHRLLTDGLVETLDLKAAQLFERSGARFQLACQRDIAPEVDRGGAEALAYEDSLVCLLRARGVLVREELTDQSQRSDRREVADRLASLGAEIAAPIAVDGELVGLVLLGERRTAESFSAEDLALLDMVTSQAGLALRKARQYDELEQRVADRTGEISQANVRLEQEVVDRRRAEQALQEAHKDLEQRVDARTAELVAANTQLRREVAERRLVEDELQKAKSDWEETFNTINDAITVHDSDYNIIRANPAAEALLRLPNSVIRQQKCFASYHGADGPPQGCPSCRVLRSGAPEQFEVYEPHLDRHLEIKAMPRCSTAGDAIGCIHVTRDISEQKQAEAEQHALQHQLQQAQKLDSIGRLAGGIAHDFNNMLTIIISCAEASLMDRPDDEDLVDALTMIQEAGLKGAEMTRQLLLFSRKQTLEMHPLDPAKLVAHMGKILGRLLGEDILLDLRTDAPVSKVMADPGQLEQVLMNLAVNARDAMPRGGRLRVEVSEAIVEESDTACQCGLKVGRCVRIEVSDSGTGMSEETQARVFEPFFTTKARGEGTGLGLSTTYGVVKQHRGHIEVDSAIGKGTRIRIYLPPCEAVRRPKPSGIHVTLPTGSETILVVEDEPTIRRVIAQTLTTLGYDVIVAASATEALGLDLDAANDVSLLLTDIILPGMNGRELAREFSARNPAARVLYMSGYTDDVLTQRGVLDPQAALMHKPLTPKKLARRVRELIDGTPDATPDHAAQN